jgi:hypothetical protein
MAEIIQTNLNDKNLPNPIQKARETREANKKIIETLTPDFYKQVLRDPKSREKILSAIRMLLNTIDSEDPKLEADLKTLRELLDNNPDLNGQREQSNKLGIRPISPYRIQEEQRKNYLNIEPKKP